MGALIREPEGEIDGVGVQAAQEHLADGNAAAMPDMVWRSAVQLAEHVRRCLIAPVVRGDQIWPGRAGKWADAHLDTGRGVALHMCGEEGSDGGGILVGHEPAGDL